MVSTRWNGIRFRDDDIIITSYGKGGTTWVQQIVNDCRGKSAAPGLPR